MGDQAEPMRVLEHVRSRGGLAAELARQRPLGADVVAQDAAEHATAGSGAGDLLDLGLAVDRIERDPERVRARDIALLLDGVAEGDAVGRGAGGEHHLDLGDRGGVEAGAEPGEQLEHFRRRVGFHGVEYARVRQRLGEGLVVVAHDVEVDDEARPVVAAVTQKLADALSHGALPSTAQGAAPPPVVMRVASLPLARVGDALATRIRNPPCCLGLEGNDPVRTAGNE